MGNHRRRSPSDLDDAASAVEPPESPVGRLAKLLESWRALLGVAVALVLVGVGFARWSGNIVRRPALERVENSVEAIDKRVEKVERSMADLAWIKAGVWELLVPTGKPIPPPP